MIGFREGHRAGGGEGWRTRRRRSDVRGGGERLHHLFGDPRDDGVVAESLGVLRGGGGGRRRRRDDDAAVVDDDDDVLVVVVLRRRPRRKQRRRRGRRRR